MHKKGYNLDFYTIVAICGIIVVVLWIVGVVMLMIAARKGRPEFRSKGYLRIPSGTRWFRFLLFKQYDAFDDSGTRFFFGVSHMCLLGVLVAAAAVVVLVGCDVFFGNMDDLPGGLGLPKVNIPR